MRKMQTNKFLPETVKKMFVSIRGLFLFYFDFFCTRKKTLDSLVAAVKGVGWDFYLCKEKKWDAGGNWAATGLLSQVPLYSPRSG